MTMRGFRKRFEEKMEEFVGNEKAFSTSLVGAALGIVILAIVVLDVAVPVVNDAITSANLTGTNATIANLIPMFLVLGLFVMVAVVFVIRWL
jgi:dTDP-4-amino-4,6-dideoxygalactose transaminase